ncbi:MAG: hypothetical protein ACKVOI_02670 [Dongiaceae bacterium]
MAAIDPAFTRRRGLMAFGIAGRDTRRVPAPLDTGDLLDMALLGLAAEPGPPRQRLTVERAAGLLRRLGGPHLSPTLDVVTGRARRLIEAGHVEMARDPAAPLAVRTHPDVPLPPHLRVTAAGAQRLRELLLAPEPDDAAPQADLAFALKLCLMDRLDAAGRACLLAQAIAAKERHRAAADQAARHWPASNIFTRRWLERQAARLADDVAWLRSLPAA